MATDATDKLLVASVLERGKRATSTTTSSRPRPDEDARSPQPRHRRRAGRAGRRRGGRHAALGGAAGQARGGRGGRALHAGRARRHGPGHGRHRRPGPHVPQGDRQGPAPQRRGGGRLRQGHRARRADRRGALEGRPLALGVDQNDTERESRAKRPEHRLDHYAAEADRIVLGCLRRGRRRTACSWPRPTCASTGAQRAATSDATKALLKDAKHSSRRTTRRPTPSLFADARRLLLHVRPQRRPGGPRQQGPARPLRLDPGRRPRGAAALHPGRQGRRGHGRVGLGPRDDPGAPQAARPARHGRALRPGGSRDAHLGQPPPRGLDRQEVHRARHVLPGPHPGGQHRPHPRGREVRLREGLQVLDLRHVVDPAGHHARHRRPGAHDPHPGPHGGDHQPAHPRLARPAPGARPRADRGGDRLRHDRRPGVRHGDPQAARRRQQLREHRGQYPQAGHDHRPRP